jgi:cytoskeletal protein CcmA (bactofilin family)
MGLFKDFKEDFSQAVNEMMPGDDMQERTSRIDDLGADTIGEKVDVRSELSKLDGLLEQVKTEDKVDLPPLEKETRPEPKPAPVIAKEERERRIMSETATIRSNTARPVMNNFNNVLSSANANVNVNANNSSSAAEETSVITAGTSLTGDITSDGSFDIQGTINGNVTCNGKLVVTGAINGNSAASEIFADVAKIEGEVVSSGTVKIGAGSVIIGNISAASAVIAGAIKGDIDVQGPVVVDTSAVIMGNIKSRSVQINNGAVIEGFCSQCYADVDVEGLFEPR